MGLTATLRLELRELLAPQVVLSKPFYWGNEEENTDEPLRVSQLVDSSLVLTTDDVHSALMELSNSELSSILPQLIGDFEQLLCDALDLLRELGEADDHRDLSYWDLPSITPHWQNRDIHNWVCLIELLRDSWLAVSVQIMPELYELHRNGSSGPILLLNDWLCSLPAKVNGSHPINGGLVDCRQLLVALVCGYRPGGVPAVGTAGRELRGKSKERWKRLSWRVLHARCIEMILKQICGIT